MGWRLWICMDAHWEDSEDQKNHLVAEKTIGEDGKEMYRELFIRQCAGSNQVPWVSARISFFLLVHNSKHGTAFHHAWTITELLGSGCRTEEGRCCSLAKWQRDKWFLWQLQWPWRTLVHLCPMILVRKMLSTTIRTKRHFPGKRKSLVNNDKGR